MNSRYGTARRVLLFGAFAAVLLLIVLLLLSAWRLLSSDRQAWAQHLAAVERLAVLHLRHGAERLRLGLDLALADGAAADALAAGDVDALQRALAGRVDALRASGHLQRFGVADAEGRSLYCSPERPVPAPLAAALRQAAPSAGIVVDATGTAMLHLIQPLGPDGRPLGYGMAGEPLAAVLDRLPLAAGEHLAAFLHAGAQPHLAGPVPRGPPRRIWHDGGPPPAPELAQLMQRHGHASAPRLATAVAATGLYQVGSVPLRGPDGRPAGRLVLARTLEPWALRNRSAFTLIAIATVALAGTLLWLFRRAGRRLATVQRELEQERDRLERRVRERTAELEQANAALSREIGLREQARSRSRARQAEMLHVTRLYSMKQLAAEVAHEVSHPLAAVRSYAAGCVRGVRHGTLSGDELCEALEALREQAERAGRVLAHLRNYQEQRGPRLAATDLEATVLQACDFVAEEVRGNGVDLQLELESGLSPLPADAVLLEQVVINLVRNALDALRGREPPRRLAVGLARAPGGAELTVWDNGPGLDPAVRERVFEPFVTTKAGGMGIGLSISRDIVQRHQGRLGVESPPRGGALFRIYLPQERYREPEHGR